MAQQTAIKPYNTFVKGLITEAGPLTYPENASLDEENFVLNRDGSRQRRLGMDLEQDFILHPHNIGPLAVLSCHLWENVANDASRNFVVVQTALKLWIFDAAAVSTSSSLVATVDATSKLDYRKTASYANAMGTCIVTGGAGLPFFLEYNPSAGTVTAFDLNIQVRDFWGAQDNLAVNDRPASLSDAHKYNLMNQGWTVALMNAYHTAAGVWPSNAQQWPLGKDPDDNFDPALLDKQDFGSTPAPRGRYLTSPFLRSDSRFMASGVTQAADFDVSRPSCVAFAFQRAFYAGCQSQVPLPLSTSPNLTGFVFYTKTTSNALDLVQCYQSADPTSEVDSELVDTDGGYIVIPESGKIHRLLPKGDTILVFAENGIWGIRGDDGGFRATVTQVFKITDFGCIGPNSVVDVEDSAMYWNRGGIYLLSMADGVPSAVNITENSIQTLFNSISNSSKANAVGSFDPTNRKISWMYSADPDYDGLNYRNKFDSELVLDMVLTAFYKNSISAVGDPSPYIAGYVTMPDPLLPKEGVRNRGTTVTKYLVVQFVDVSTDTASISFAYYRDGGFRDWRSIDGEGTSFVSYMLSGYEIMGDSMRNKRVDYITCHFKMTERNSVATDDGVTADNPSGCFVQAQWEWSNHPDSGKWGEPFQAYRLLRPFVLPPAGEPINYGNEVTTTKSRLPGSGKSLSLLFQSDEDKDCYLYGWSIKMSGASSV